MLLKEKTAEIDYYENWPDHYYEIADIGRREQVLESLLSDRAAEEELPAQTPEARAENAMRLAILRLRYPKETREGKSQKDLFVTAWMNLLISGRSSMNFFTRRRIEGELRLHIGNLGIPLEEGQESESSRRVKAAGEAEGWNALRGQDPVLFQRLLREEWRNFAEFWIESCIRDRTYSTAAFGLFHLKDENLARKIAEEIQEVTRDIPDKIGLQRECYEFRRLMIETYCRMIQDGSRYITE